MEKQFGVLGIQLNTRENRQRSERCVLQHECHFLMPMRCFLTSSTRTHICNEAAKEDYCSTQFYFIFAFFTRLLQTAIRNLLAAEAVWENAAELSYSIDLGKRTNCCELASDWWAGPTRMNAQKEHFTHLRVWTVPHTLQQGIYPTPQFSSVTTGSLINSTLQWDCWFADRAEISLYFLYY